MTNRNPAKLPEPVSAAYARLKERPENVGRAVELAALLHQYGYHDSAIDLRNQIVATMSAAARRNVDPNILIDIERLLYSRLVKKIESEENTRAAFQSWLRTMSDLGRKFQSRDLPSALRSPSRERPWRAAFLLSNAVMLGHTDMMLAMLRYRPKSELWNERPIVFALIGENEKLERALADIGVQLICLEKESGLPPLKAVETFSFLRQRIAQEGVTHLVWVSAPATSDFAFAMRLAPAQIFWTLKFHPYRLDEIDGYISYGSWHETIRLVHGEEWQVVPQSLETPSRQVTEQEVADARRPYARHEVLLGTLARSDKFNSTSFVQAVIRILLDNPNAGYLWTGREIHAGVQEQFERAGVADQCHFIGWVDTAVYASTLDIFLETFPFGCGITGMQALYAGTPLLSFQSPETILGIHLARALADNDPLAEEFRGLIASGDNAGLLYPGTVDEYVALASRLIREPQFRTATGAAGKEFYAKYLDNSSKMARRFFDILETCKQPSSLER